MEGATGSGRIFEPNLGGMSQRRFGILAQLAERVGKKLNGLVRLEEQAPRTLQLRTAWHGVGQFATLRPEDELFLMHIEGVHRSLQQLDAGLANTELALELAQRRFGELGLPQ